MQPRADSTTAPKSLFQLDEDQIARQKDREEWVRQATQKRKERIMELNEARKALENSGKSREGQRGIVERDMIDQMLEDLCRLNPEWQIRKEAARRVSRKSFYELKQDIYYTDLFLRGRRNERKRRHRIADYATPNTLWVFRHLVYHIYLFSYSFP
jgi:hypothetical protein